MIHWSADHIGRPWVPGISDCWSFAREVWAQRFGWTVPPIMVDPSDLRAAVRALSDPGGAGWRQVEVPSEGDAVLMGRAQRPCHVGIWIEPPEGAGILHSVERTGVIFTPPARLQLMGLRLLGTWARQA